MKTTKIGKNKRPNKSPKVQHYFHANFMQDKNEAVFFKLGEMIGNKIYIQRKTSYGRRASGS